jgi:signal transduction histidine kinase/ligand-binding sensor domain-containing protein/CheY-like chemotaxis protein
MMMRRAGAVLSLCLIAWVASVHAQVLPVIQYTELDGLTSTAVQGLAQDAEGNVWLATRNGIVCYDGRRWSTGDGKQDFPGVSLGCLAIDGRGDIWGVSHWTNTLVLRESGIWRTIRLTGTGLAHNEVHHIMPAPRRGAQHEAVMLTFNGQAIAVRGTRCWPLDIPGDPDWLAGGVWNDDGIFLASTAGLYRLDADLENPRPGLVDGLPPGPVAAVLPLPETGALLVVGLTWRGVLRDGQFSLQRTLEPLDLPLANYGVAADRDATGAVYLGDRTHLYRIPAGDEPVVQLSRSHGLVSKGASSILADRAGPIWVGSLRGLDKLIDPHVRGYDGRHGLLDDEVSAVLHRPGHAPLLGHAGGITILEDPPRTIVFEGLEPNRARVSDLLEARDGTVWVAASSQGVGRLQADGQVAWLSERFGLDEELFALAEDAAGRLWVGGAGGLWRIEDGRAVSVALEKPTAHDVYLIRRLMVAADGAIWAAANDLGVHRIEGDDRALYLADDERMRSTFTVFEDHDGRILVGTAGGLAEVQGRRLVRCTLPVIDRPVYALAQDDAGRLWAGTDQGVRAWDGQRLRRISARDGLLGSETNRDALAFDQQGNLWVGTDRGVTVFDRRREDRAPFLPPVRIERIELGGHVLPDDAPIEFTAGAGELVFDFRSTPFADERRLEFRTWLEGLEADWLPAAPNPTQRVRYTNLAPGRYRFHVQALVPGQPAGEPATTPEIKVIPPLWQRPWFVALEILVGCSLLVLMVAAWQSRRAAGRLEREVAERTGELTASEAALRRESQRLASTLASISDAVLVVDGHQRVVMGNPAAARLTDRAVGQLAGIPLAHLFPDLPVPARSGPIFEYRFQPTLEVPARHLEVAAAGLDDPGDDGGLVLAFRDVTDRRRLEQERARVQNLESLGSLAGGMAHDFNNLMTVILGHVSLLESADGLQADERTSLDRMRAAAEQVQALTGQLLTFARGGAPRKQQTDLAAVIDQAVGLAGHGATLDVRVDLPADLQPVDADPLQLAQVFSNLLTNALEAQPRGCRVWVGGRNLTDDDGRWVEVTVRDNGPGIAPDLVDRVFEPYFSTRDASAGLGLAICHSVVTRHGGKLWLERSSAGGAEVILRLPVAVPQPLDGPGAAAADDGSSAAACRVLVVDDEEAVRGIVVLMLERLGHQCVAVADGAAAVEVFAEARAAQPFDVVIVDLNLEDGMGGLEAFRQLRAMDPEVRGIVASGYSHDPVLSKPAAHGFAAILAKPFDRQALVEALAAVRR